MHNKNQQGFSLIELLLVVVILGIISSIAVPSLLKAKQATEESSAVATLRTMSTLQVNGFTTRNRFSRLDELNSTQNGSLGTNGSNSLIRGKFTFTMSPAAPTDDELKKQYKIIATRPATGDQTLLIYELTQSGEIVKLP